MAPSWMRMQAWLPTVAPCASQHHVLRGTAEAVQRSLEAHILPFRLLTSAVIGDGGPGNG